MRASLATKTRCVPDACVPSRAVMSASDTAAVSRLPTGHTGMPSASPKPCAMAQATRRLVKAPGPASNATPASSAGVHPDSSSTRETRGRIRAEWAWPTDSCASASAPGESPRCNATEADSPKMAIASSGPRGGTSVRLIGADCTERIGGRGGAARAADSCLARSARAATVEGNDVLAQLLAQGAALFGGEPGGGNAADGSGTGGGLRPDARRGTRGGDVLAHLVLARQLGSEPGAFQFPHAADVLRKGFDADGQRHEPEDERGGSHGLHSI